nr:hypothetical protein BaRGS_003076 [Batillaria attramentaria]
MEHMHAEKERVELWPDYWSRFCTFLVANAVPDDRKAQVFLTNQTPAVYKQLANLAAQQNPKTDINSLTMDQIVEFMKEQFDPKLFIVRERFKFWSNMERKPGETLQELAARIRQDAATCDFPSIQDPQDEALRQRFICSVNNEAVLKALFKVKDTELDFAKAVKIAIETEDAAKVAKETVYGSKPRPVNKVKMNNKGGRPKSHQQSNSTTSDSAKCYRLDVPITIQDQQFTMELDTATTGNFVSVPVWKQLGKPKLDDVTHRYESASKHDLPVLGTFMGQTKDPVTGKQSSIPYIVTKIPDLNLLGRNAIQALGISVDNALGLKSIESQVKSEGAKESHPKTSSTTYASLQKDCHTLCDKFPDLFKEELGCLKDFELEIKFKSDAKPVFHKARPVPFALRDDLTKVYEEGIAKGVWKPVQFNDYGTPVVPIRKTNSTGALKPKLRICGDYSVGINDQLADHRHPMPLPEELMQKLGGGFGYTKIDLADAYNQIKLAPESQRRLALSTHRGVLLQQRLPFGIKSAPGYFQEIMENLTSDLPGVAVFQDDILTSGKDAKDHLSNLERLLTRLNDKGLRCRREKCLFAQPSVEYLGHTLSAEGISKGSKVEAVLKMPPPTDVSSLKSFLGSVQFYWKFIPNLATMAEPLYRLTKKANPWKWGEEEQAAFEQLKNVLSSDQVLVHFDPDKPVGLACDASNVGIGAVLFHRYPDGSERPIANVSKTLTAAERNYSQIHKEALAIIYGLRKFYQYLYGRQFILVTDHKPLTALFGPKKGTPLLAANRLARWALWLNQFDYTIEYRKTADHGNADALSCLPSGDDIDFDREESGEDTDMVCAIRVLSLQVKPFDSSILRQESGKDPVIATVMRYVREGWPLKHAEINEEVRKFQKLSDSLSTCHGCLIYGTRVVIPQSLQPKILDLLHIGHFVVSRNSMAANRCKQMTDPFATPERRLCVSGLTRTAKELKTRKPTVCMVKQWTPDAVARLQDGLDCTDWETLCSDNMDETVMVVSEYIKWCEQKEIPTKKVKVFPNSDNDNSLLGEMQKMLQEMFTEQERKLTECIASVRDQVAEMSKSLDMLHGEVTDLRERTERLESTTEAMCHKSCEQMAAIDSLEKRLNQMQEEFDKKVDKLESCSRRDNLKFFGIPETTGETFVIRARKIVDVLKNTVPNRDWKTEDIIRAHRSRTLKRYREDGINAYYKGDKLVVGGPRRPRHAADQGYDSSNAEGHTDSDVNRTRSPSNSDSGGDIGGVSAADRNVSPPDANAKLSEADSLLVQTDRGDVTSTGVVTRNRARGGGVGARETRAATPTQRDG